MTYEQWLNEESLTDLWLDHEDDIALIVNAIKPWQLDGQPHTPEVEQWFADNWAIEC